MPSLPGHSTLSAVAGRPTRPSSLSAAAQAATRNGKPVAFRIWSANTSWQRESSCRRWRWEVQFGHGTPYGVDLRRGRLRPSGPAAVVRPGRGRRRAGRHLGRPEVGWFRRSDQPQRDIRGDGRNTGRLPDGMPAGRPGLTALFLSRLEGRIRRALPRRPEHHSDPPGLDRDRRRADQSLDSPQPRPQRRVAAGLLLRRGIRTGHDGPRRRQRGRPRPVLPGAAGRRPGAGGDHGLQCRPVRVRRHPAQRGAGAARAVAVHRSGRAGNSLGRGRSRRRWSGLAGRTVRLRLRPRARADTPPDPVEMGVRAGG
ncbi:hypothetical protein Namu_2507 [Nakamurella multipartita DSM 44233]|uniref:Uncharacterized protein n=1 Tax=Nakamurella multipartita (strain ATCC 700099 / DSM 44233 / CIP 104796 / JCM 9543 / NBRC 105858 / Y-104) TaxID=479431 RepID=C8X6L9_NAKMY|nr:hypothetical protein Namu_2507 [Nakamurella multipartita DSM 44233]